MSRTFTLVEAHTLLPILESLLKQAIHGKKLIEEVAGPETAGSSAALG